MLTPCRKTRPFAHAGDRALRLLQFADRFDRYDNFYNGYNADLQMLRRVCCNPFQAGGRCCCYCCGNR